MTDGQNLTFTAEFEAVLSNAALHWMCGQEAVLAGVPRPMVLPTGLEAWLDTSVEDFLGAVAESDQLQARTEVSDLLRPVLMDETGTWSADYVRLRFRAIRAVA